MLSSSLNNENTSHPRPDTITIAVGCTHATMGSCILNLQRKSSNSSRPVKCVNDATHNHNDDLFQYYRCQKHDIIMCCGCIDTEQKKEKQETQQSNKFNDEPYEPEEGEIIHDESSGDGYWNQGKYGQKKSQPKFANKKNRKRKAPSSNVNELPPNKKIKANNQNLEFHINAIVQIMTTDQQNEIQQLKEYKKGSIEREKKLNGRIAALENKLKQKDESIQNYAKEYSKIKREKYALEASFNEKIKRMSGIFEKNKNDIIAKNKKEVGKLQKLNESYKKTNNELKSSYEKTIAELKETDRFLREVLNESRKSNKKMEIENKKKIDKISTDNERIRRNLKTARDSLTFPQFINKINAFLD